MTLANLYLLGAPKCGTTTVAGWLAGHRDVHWSIPKEPYYWAEDFPGQRAHYGFDSREAYESLYSSTAARTARYRGDASTTYLYSQRAVPEILSNVSDPRFVVCLRNPVDLLVSYHRTQLVALNEDEPDFAVAWRRSLSGGLPVSSPLDPKLVDYPLMGRLGAAMRRLYDAVPRENVHVVVLDDLRDDPGDTWTRLARALDLDPAPMPELTAVANQSNKAYRSRALRRLTHRPPTALAPSVRRLRQWARTTNVAGVHAIKRSMWRPEPRPTLDPELRSELADYFRSDIELLSSLVGRDHTSWTGVPVA
jgi:hypothetical protein